MTYLFFTGTLNYCSLQPITRQQLKAFRHEDAFKSTCWTSNWASEWGTKAILNLAWLVPNDQVWAFLKLFPHNHLLTLQGIVQKIENILCSRSLGKNALLMPKVRGEQPDCFKLMRRKTVAQITTCCKSLNAQHAEPWSRWATAVEDYHGLQCRLRRGNCGYSSHRFIRTGLPATHSGS